MLSRRTALGPTYAGAVRDVKVVPIQGENKYVAYRTGEKVVGVVKCPLDGNPHKAMGLIAHPGSVSESVPVYIN